ncbi:VPS4-associated protein 1 [Gongronella butleri]|nr:VPS4-associated protein 1 [Gongronella butleri]
MPPKDFSNQYIARLTADERPCFVCSKFTTVVLTSANGSNADWFYVCRAHLGDTHFCTKLGGNTPPVAAKPKPKSPTYDSDKQPESDSVLDLMSSIGSAFTAWRAKDKDKEKDEKKKNDKDDDEKDKKKKKEDEDKSNDGSAPPSPAASATTTSSPSSPAASKPIFILQRDYFYMRQRKAYKSLQQKRATESLNKLEFPDVPTHAPGRPQSS